MKMESKSILYLSRQDVEGVGLSMQEIILALEAMFKEKGEGRYEMPPKPGIHPREEAFIHAMPAYLPNPGVAGVKWISGYPDNQKRGLPYITGLLVLNDPDTGIPTAVMDATWITAKRTGAATGVAAKYLARKDSSTVGILACGVQGRSNLEALSTLFKLRKVKAYDILPEVARKFAREMGKVLQLDIEVVNHPREAVENLDIVVTSGPVLKNPNPAIEPGWMAEGAFASPVDFDSYWQAGAFEEAQKLATDDVEQMDYYRVQGYFQATPRPYADLGEIVSGRKPGRENESERTFSINLGLALDDLATGYLVLKKARERGLGSELPL